MLLDEDISRLATELSALPLCNHNPSQNEHCFLQETGLLVDSSNGAPCGAVNWFEKYPSLSRLYEVVASLRSRSQHSEMEIPVPSSIVNPCRDTSTKKRGVSTEEGLHNTNGGPTTTTTIQDLSQDTLLQILTHQELSTISLVCKRWHQAVVELRKRESTIGMATDHLLDLAINYVLEKYPKVSFIDFRGFQELPNRSLKLFPQITKLRALYHTEESLILLNKCPNIEELEVFTNVSSDWLRWVAQNRPTKLSSLYLKLPPSVTPEDCANVYQLVAGLKKLRLSAKKTSGFPLDFAERLAANCSSLHHLRLSRRCQGGNMFSTRLNAPNLSFLSCHIAPGFDYTLFARHQALTELWLSANTSLVSRVLESVFTLCQLKHLTLTLKGGGMDPKQFLSVLLETMQPEKPGVQTLEELDLLIDYQINSPEYGVWTSKLQEELDQLHAKCPKLQKVLVYHNRILFIYQMTSSSWKVL